LHTLQRGGTRTINGFAFGTWKIEVLAGFASAIFLLGIAALMVVTSVERFFVPQPIHYTQAIPIAVVGLMVNLACAFILGNAHHHGRDIVDHHHDEHGRHAHDLNLRIRVIIT
jgi:Co/Zn/Cd efflux system component